ncbi:MAG: carboxylesterase family protein [Gammaproteobacteria bacterium]|nr:carboxylesterase family protein [Gammaproteobacteria bacterium]
MKKHIGFYIAFPIYYTLLSLIFFFYLDLANGPLYLFPISIIVFLLYAIVRILFLERKFIFKFAQFLSLIISIVIIVLLATPKTTTFSATRSSKTDLTDVVEVNEGKLVGTYNEDKSVKIYTGIPYAKAPVGDLRWKEPEDPASWTGVRECITFAPKAMQSVSNPVMSTIVDIYAAKSWHPDYRMNSNQNMSEDCLYLNIWAPNTNETNLPVLVYIHGGSLNSGSPAFKDYNGEEMAKKGVIMINVAYRLGIFGYYASDELKAESPNGTTGNYGLLDQIKALEWINNNIASFNGDKTNITIAGESAGSSSVSALCSSPLAKGLFKNAIGESSSLVLKTPPHTFRSYDRAIKDNEDVMEYLNCTSLGELRNVSAEKLMEASEHFSNSSMTLDGYALTKTPYEVYKAGENNETNLLNGSNILEADAFIIPTYLLSPTNMSNIEERISGVFGNDLAKKMLATYDYSTDKEAFLVFNEIISIYWFIYPHYSWSRLAYNNGVNVYRYTFTKENGYYGTYHSGELIYAYGNVKHDNTNYKYDESDLVLSDIMLEYWANFAKYGNPSYSEHVWNKWTPANKVQELGENVGEIEDRFAKIYGYIDEFMGNTYE